MDKGLLAREPPMLTERTVGRTLFSFRWLLAPFYLGLAISLLVLLIKFSQKTAAQLVSNAMPASSSEVITVVLSLIDISLIASWS